MILINRLLQTPIGWSDTIQSRYDRAQEVCGYTNVEFYPKKRFLDTKYVVYNIEKELQRYGKKSAEFLTHYSKEIDKIIFLDTGQVPYRQILSAPHIPYEAVIRVSKDYRHYDMFDDEFYDFLQEFNNPIVHTKHTACSYGYKSYRVVGNPVARFDDTYLNCKENFAVWSGHNINSRVKGWREFLYVVRDNPSINFVACITGLCVSYSLPNLKLLYNKTSQEYMEIVKKARWMVSTALAETFGNSIFDAISVGTVPLCYSVGSYKEILPKKFLWHYSPFFHTELSREEAVQILEPYYAENVLTRLVEGTSL